MNKCSKCKENSDKVGYLCWNCYCLNKDKAVNSVIYDILNIIDKHINYEKKNIDIIDILLLRKEIKELEQ